MAIEKGPASHAERYISQSQVRQRGDKDKILPLIDYLAVIADWEGTADIAQAVAEAQREADWKRIQCLIGTIL